jgi:hypothetical protein
MPQGVWFCGMRMRLLLGVLLAGTLAPGTAEAAYESCSYDAVAKTVTATRSVAAEGRLIAVAGQIKSVGDGSSVQCGIATTSNTDTVKYVTTVAGNDNIDLSGGPFAPGASNEGDGSSEIEFQHPGLGTVTIRGTSSADHINGGVGSANLNPDEAGADADVTMADTGLILFGGGGADTLVGPAILRGGLGNDQLIAPVGGTTVLDYAEAAAGITVTLPTGGADGEGNTDSFILAGPTVLRGSPFADIIGGSSGADTIAGSDGADTVDAGDGDDVIDEGGRHGERTPNGGDALHGGAGRDVVVYSDASAARDVPVAVTLDDAANDGASGEADNVFSDVEDVVGTPGDDTLAGSAATNALTGGAGNDTLTGGAGRDALRGGDGVDTLLSNDGESDDVACGAGADSVSGDVPDVVDADCESINRNVPSVPPPPPVQPAPVSRAPVKKTPSFASVVTLPSTAALRSCTSRGRFRVRLKAPKGDRITSVVITVNAKTKRRLTGTSKKKVAPTVNLRGLPKGRFTVKVTVKLASRKTLMGSRTYKTCTPRRG